MEFLQNNPGVIVKFMKILLLFIFLSAVLYAQPENEIKLNLEKSIKIALENNSDLKQIKLEMAVLISGRTMHNIATYLLKICNKKVALANCGIYF